MKYIITLIFIFVFLIQEVYAVTTTTAPTVSTGEKLIDEINNLREKVASKVAELNLVEKRGIFVIVTDLTGNKITGNDLSNTTRLIDVDELTEFSSPSAKTTFGISDITKGAKLSIIGLYNKQSKRILARFVETSNLPQTVSGTITEIDKANFTVNMKSINNTEYLIDVESITKTSSYSAKDGLTRLGFSKLELFKRIYVVGYESLKEKNRMSASRIIIFPELPNYPDLNLENTATNPTQKPTASPVRKVIPTE